MWTCIECGSRLDVHGLIQRWPLLADSVLSLPTPPSCRCDYCFSLFSRFCVILLAVEIVQMGYTSTDMGLAALRLGWGLLTLLIGTAILRRTRTWLRLRHIPGPRFAGVSELWLLRKTFGGRCHLDTAEACSKYGA